MAKKKLKQQEKIESLSLNGCYPGNPIFNATSKSYTYTPQWRAIAGMEEASKNTQSLQETGEGPWLPTVIGTAQPLVSVPQRHTLRCENRQESPYDCMFTRYKRER